jgi:peptidoglycan/LPS O-acetylase OafA/YrhL
MPVVFSIALYLLYFFDVIILAEITLFKMAFTFLLGAWIAYFYVNTKRRIPVNLAWLLFFLVLGFVISTKASWIAVPFIFLHYIWGACALLCVLIALFCLPITCPQNKIVQLINHYGEISYSIYLYHILFLGVAVLLINKYQIYGDEIKLLFVFAFTLVTSYLFAAISYRFIELPSIKLGKIITAKYQ